MNIAIINQGCGRYLFEVPANIALKEGDRVKCDTRKGITDGVVFCDSAEVEEPAAKLIGKLLGAKFPLKSVVGKTVTSVEMFEQPKPEPVKLYCVEDYSGFTTKGKVYEFTDGDIRLDDGGYNAGWFTDYAGFVSYNRGIALCLVPLVSRPAKVGEWVLMIHGNPGLYKKGDVSEVVKTDIDNIVLVKNTSIHDETWICDSNYLVLDGYDGRYEKAEPEYYNGKVVCVDNGFIATLTVGKVYEVKDGFFYNDAGRKNPLATGAIKTLEDMNARHSAKFIEFKGE